ncbi:MAG: hypothetical protein WCF84_13305 [Anaerolineae bacterium]
MGNLLILKYDSAKPHMNYRGTERARPYYCEGLDENHEANQAFFRFLKESDMQQLVHGLDHAKELVQIYQRLDPPQIFEIIEVTSGNEMPTYGGEFLGFDLSNFNLSLVYGVVQYEAPSPGRAWQYAAADDLCWVLAPLISLLKKHFRPKLNANGLFDDYETAQFCLDCMMAFQKLRPSLFEGEDSNLQVLGLWRIYP